MEASSTGVPQGLERGFLTETYKGLCAKLAEWRLDEDMFDARRWVLPFVRGLRFSSLLVYSIRKVLRETKLKACWGAILGDKSCSPECDVIVHEKKHPFAWDGHDSVGKRVMDFRFIRPEHAKVVIECKSGLDAIDEKTTRYVQKLQGHVRRVWLFAECCRPRRVGFLRMRALEAGYERFWYLYTLQEGRLGQEYDEQGWMDFVDQLRKLDK